MTREEFYYDSADGKTRIHAVKWIPDQDIKAIVYIAHGVTEHILRYEELAKYLTDRGILVVGNDHLGHGTSLGQKMYFGPSGSWNYVVKDMEKCRMIIQEEYTNISYFMLGFSLGSFLLRTYLIDYDTYIDGAIIVGTGYISGLEGMIANLVVKNEIKKFGEENATDRVKVLTFDTYNKIFAPVRTDYDWLSLSVKNIDEYINDPLRGGCMSAGLFRELLSGMIYTGKLSNISKMNKDIPILLLSGDMDPVGSQTKGVIKVYNCFKKVGISDITINFYKNLRHDILHEDNKDEIYEFIYNWLLSRI